MKFYEVVLTNKRTGNEIKVKYIETKNEQKAIPIIMGYIQTTLKEMEQNLETLGLAMDEYLVHIQAA